MLRLLTAKRLGMAASAVLLALTAAMAHAADQPGPATRIIVKFKDTGMQGTYKAHPATEQVLKSVAASRGVGLEKVRTLGTGAELVLVKGHANLETLAAELAKNANVEYAEPDRMLQPLLTPNDTRYSEQWHYFENTGGIRMPAAWDTTSGSGAIVAVLDTGYRPHVDLNDNILAGYDMIDDTFVANDGDGRDSDAQDPGDWVEAGECGGGYPPSDQSSSWHGTHVAGTVAAETNNSQGVAGVAYGARIVPVRVLGKCGGYTSDIADGIIWASGGSVSGVPSNANPADVINMSLGGSGSCGSTTQNAINVARNNGTTVVVAAGNSNDDANNYNPGNCSGVVNVAATNRDGGRSYYSNYGSVVDLAAPGGDMRSSSSNGILSTLNSGSTTPGSDTYAWYQGTSMATPHVAGVAALIKSVDPSLTPDDVESILKNTARAFPASCSGCGTGIADANAAVASAGGGGGGGGGELQNGVPVDNLSGAQGSETDFFINVPAGASNLEISISGGSGDADLYVKFGSEPTTSSYDCRPYLNGNNETCSFPSPQEGTYYIMLRGYTSYSGVSLVGSYDEGGGGSCPTGSDSYAGTLTGSGDDEFEPDGTYYYSGSGTHVGNLEGPSGTDFDLYLWKWNGSSWSTVASSLSSSSSESITYNGTSGYYVWRIYSYSGSGDYSFCLDRP